VNLIISNTIKYTKRYFQEFKQDLILILNTAHLIDACYEKGNRFFYHYKKRYKRLIEYFNKKYPNLYIIIKDNWLEFRPQIFVKGNLKEIEFILEKSDTHKSLYVFNKDSKLIEILYNREVISDSSSTEFQILFHFALKEVNAFNLIEYYNFCFDYDPLDYRWRGL
jgi:hypothetical protein